MLGHESRDPLWDRTWVKRIRVAIDEETFAAAAFLARARRQVRIVLGRINVDGMAMAPDHVKALARSRGWNG
jgi:hypothetical protein